MKNSVPCRFLRATTVLAASSNSSYSGLGSLTPGNKSDIIPSNSGTSGDKNWREDSGEEREIVGIVGERVGDSGGESGG